jgi:hypothetical protein
MASYIPTKIQTDTTMLDPSKIDPTELGARHKLAKALAKKNAITSICFFFPCKG